MFKRYSLIQAALSLLERKDSFPESFISRFSPIFLTIAKFATACLARLMLNDKIFFNQI
jgi:hypothetical protein